MSGYYSVENCSPDELDELCNSYFWADDTDQAELDALDISDPSEVPDWLLYREYAGIMFVEEDFLCNCHG